MSSWSSCMPTKLPPLFELDCKPIDPDPIRGFLLHENRSFIVLHNYETGVFALNGYTMVRRNVIKSSKLMPSTEMPLRIAQAKRLRPAVPAGVGFSNCRALLESASSEFPLLTVYQERIFRGECFIGRPVKFNAQALWLENLSSSAEWGGFWRISYRNITRVDFGGEYERWLHRFAGPRTEPSQSR